MLPAQQRLEADHDPGVDRHLRLVDDPELAPLDGVAQVVLEGAAVADLRGEDRLEIPVDAPAVVLGAVQRGVGVVEQGLGVLRIGRAQARCRCWSPGSARAGPLVALADHPQDLLGKEPGLLGLRDRGHQDRELVAAEARHHLPRAQHRHDPARQGLEQAVAHGVAVEVVDVLEPVEVEAETATRPPPARAAAISSSRRAPKLARFGRPVRVS